MTQPPNHDLAASDLPVALYLNQRVAFDLLATLEGGFTQLTSIQRSSSDGKASSAGVEAGLGSSNPFAWLGITFGAKGSREASSTSSGTSAEELVHTPTSLFARLRQELKRRELIRAIEGEENGLSSVKPGDFVEFQATLRRSPLVDVLTTFRQLLPMADVFSPSIQTSGGAGKNQRGSPKQPNQAQVLLRQVEGMLQAITAEGSKDLIADCGSLRFVLTAEEAFFVDPTMNDVIDGTFRIFGKVTRVVPRGASSGISLLRKSALGNFGGMVEQLGTAFESLPDAGFTGQKVETEVPAPTLQVIPIAIFA